MVRTHRERMPASSLQRAADYVSFLGRMDEDVALLPAPHIDQFDVRKMNWWHGSHGPRKYASIIAAACSCLCELSREHGLGRGTAPCTAHWSV